MALYQDQFHVLSYALRDRIREEFEENRRKLLRKNHPKWYLLGEIYDLFLTERQQILELHHRQNEILKNLRKLFETTYTIDETATFDEITELLRPELKSTISRDNANKEILTLVDRWQRSIKNPDPELHRFSFRYALRPPINSEKKRKKKRH
jgi:hypothetical protein